MEINLRPPQDSLQSKWNSELEEKLQNVEKKIIKGTKKPKEKNKQKWSIE